MTSAPSRFDSILEALRTIILNFLAVVEFLVELTAEDDPDDWAEELLQLMQEDKTEALLLATAEFLQIGKKCVHYSEGHLSQNNLITAARDDLQMKKEFQQLFFQEKMGCPSASHPSTHVGITASSSIGSEVRQMRQEKLSS